MDPEVEGQGNSDPVVESQDSQVSGQESTTENQESNGNPAWRSALDNIPPEFHPHLEKSFGDWDKGVQNRFEKVQQEFAPYKEFAELGVKSDELSQGMQLLHMFTTQPKELFDYLQTQFNFGQAESQGQQKAEEQDYDLSNEEYDLEKDPRFIELSKKASFAEQAIIENQNIQIQAQVKAEVDNEVKAVTEKFPGLNIADVAAMANGMAGDGMPDLMKAAERMASYLPKDRVSDSAPPVLSGNRGLPAQNTDFGKMTSQERAKFVADRMAALQS